MASRRSELNSLAARYGFDLKRSSNHLIWMHAITRKVVTTSKTSSDRRALKNIERHFKKAAA